MVKVGLEHRIDIWATKMYNSFREDLVAFKKARFCDEDEDA